jgi:hypothetical protein
MSVIDGVVFSLADISGKGFTVVLVPLRLFRFLSLPLLYKICHPWIGACGVIGRIGKRKDILVRSNGEAFDLAKFRVFQLFAQFLSKVSPAGFVIGERHAQASDGASVVLLILWHIIE